MDGMQEDILRSQGGNEITNLAKRLDALNTGNPAAQAASEEFERLATADIHVSLAGISSDGALKGLNAQLQNDSTLAGRIEKLAVQNPNALKQKLPEMFAHPETANAAITAALKPSAAAAPALAAGAPGATDSDTQQVAAAAPPAPSTPPAPSGTTKPTATTGGGTTQTQTNTAPANPLSGLLGMFGGGGERSAASFFDGSSRGGGGGLGGLMNTIMGFITKILTALGLGGLMGGGTAVAAKPPAPPATQTASTNAPAGPAPKPALAPAPAPAPAATTPVASATAGATPSIDRVAPNPAPAATPVASAAPGGGSIDRLATSN
jgi:hypothetical protein